MNAVETLGLTHRYGQQVALDNLNFSAPAGIIFAMLGPNGGGKTTLFRLLSTLIPVQQGRASILGLALPTDVDAVRRRLGVVFQAPSLDKKLTVAENLRHAGRLYGMSGVGLKGKIAAMLERFALADRAQHLVETLSGGLRRRVELAKGMLHAPRMLLLDEPSTGLDPGARGELWTYLRQLQRQGVSIILTTHLLEEAEKADQIAILSAGKLVAQDTPEALRSTVGGDSITIQTANAAALAADIAVKFGYVATVLETHVRLEQADGHLLIPRLFEAFPGRIDSLTLGKPTLEDVFIARTGKRFYQNSQEPGHV